MIWPVEILCRRSYAEENITNGCRCRFGFSAIVIVGVNNPCRQQGFFVGKACRTRSKSLCGLKRKKQYRHQYGNDSNNHKQLSVNAFVLLMTSLD